MYSVCADEEEIFAGKAMFYKVLGSGEYDAKNVILAHRGGRIECAVRILPDGEHWLYLNEESGWHAFGRINDIGGDGIASILCEINFPEYDIDRQIAGVVLRDEVGNYCIGHRGKLGGGVRGRTTERFWRLYDGGRLDVMDGDGNTPIALVCGLGNPDVGLQLAEFLGQISNMRDQENN
ncbi:MAG: hypothetical protein V3U84_07630 [Thiotrichaceae bacterium]